MRRPDWQLRFAEFATARASMPFEWGSNDCCLFAADAVLAMTGADPAAPLRGYGSAIAAQRLIDEAGGLQPLVASVLGQAVDPVWAAIGDVVMLTNEGRDLVGICNGTSVLAPGADGVVVLGMDAAKAAWKI